MIPKDLTGQQLIKKLKPFGYETIRQNGSHIRIQTAKNGKHSETVPNHKPMREGTVKSILKNIAKHFGLTIDELEEQLFGK
jgi:predicted RNA binding protein YcfA (HicA-like mRNA interferase family)